MSVKKIFMTLIVIVMCIILGAFLINTLLPNVTAQVINSAEDSIWKATGMEFDFNADGNIGSGDNNYANDGVGEDGGVIDNGGAVAGFN